MVLGVMEVTVSTGKDPPGSQLSAWQRVVESRTRTGRAKRISFRDDARKLSTARMK
jgi:hypothetical protein